MAADERRALDGLYHGDRTLGTAADWRHAAGANSQQPGQGEKLAHAGSPERWRMLAETHLEDWSSSAMCTRKHRSAYNVELCFITCTIMYPLRHNRRSSECGGAEPSTSRARPMVQVDAQGEMYH